MDSKMDGLVLLAYCGTLYGAAGKLVNPIKATSRTLYPELYCSTSK